MSNYLYRFNKENVNIFYHKRTNNGHKMLFNNSNDKDRSIYLINTDEEINNMELVSKYIAGKVFEILNQENMKIVHMDFFNSKLEFFISRSSKNKYIMNMYFSLKSYNDLIENEKEFIDSVNELNLDFLKSVSLDQDNNHVLDMTLIFLIDKNKIDEFIKNLFYINYVKIIEFIIDTISVYADDYKKFNEEINILLDHRNFVEEITYKEYKKIMTKEMFI
ncbi:hypothetical protein UFVDC4_00216 [Staphylococcus phage vB_SauM-UFV_DC4]|nr:hypothetical protein UFVDC4_00216 [Staphylococcus phage vB_SauM-UFV_DC4]BDE75794.1 hypothetical protein [Staphylococcus phage S6]